LLFRSDDRGDNWSAVSPDLTRQIDRNKLKVMGRVWGVDAVAKNASTSLYGNIVALDESPKIEGLLYVGTDEGLIQVSEDGGQNWRKYDGWSSLELPEFGYISDIEADLHDDQVVYAAINNHKRGDFKPYVVKSRDRGQSWTSITGNLPERGSVYTLKQDHVSPNLLFCGTEFGCFFTTDGGNKWVQLKSGLPTIAVRDIEIQRREGDLVLGTFGRGIYVLDDYSPLRGVNQELIEKNHIFPIKPGQMYRVVNEMGSGVRAFQGANFYTAPNPDYGVTFTMHLKDELKSKKSQREKRDRELHRAGKDVPYPSWETLKTEDREVAPTRWLTVRDAEGEVVRKLSISTDKGMLRATWDFRHSSGSGGGRRSEGGGGPIAVPGKYSVEVSQMIEGKVSQITDKAEFEIEPLNFGDTTEVDRNEILSFSKQVFKLANAVRAANEQASDAAEQLAAAAALTSNSAQVDPEHWQSIRKLQLQLTDLRERFSGDPTRPQRNEDAMPGIQSRLSVAMMGALGSTTGPTGSHRRQYEIAAEQFEAALKELNPLVQKRIPALLKRMDTLGAPWTPGRPIPDWKAK
jgi:hypothetical protein